MYLVWVVCVSSASRVRFDSSDVLVGSFHPSNMCLSENRLNEFHVSLIVHSSGSLKPSQMVNR